MATRIHVIGARMCDAKDFAKALRLPAPGEFHQCRGWCYLIASAWQQNTIDLDSALSQLPGPCLRVTSEDACRWFLRLEKRGMPPYACCHPFASLRRIPAANAIVVEPVASKAARSRWLRLIAPSPRNPVSAAPEKGPNAVQDVALLRAEMSRTAQFLYDQRVQFGTIAPADLVEKLLSIDYAHAMRNYVVWQSEDIIDALSKFSIPHDAATIRGILTGALVSDGEFQSDLGNMPRFLTALGFGSPFNTWIEEAAECS